MSDKPNVLPLGKLGRNEDNGPDIEEAGVIIGGLAVHFAKSPAIFVGVIENLERLGIRGDKLVEAFDGCVRSSDRADPKKRFGVESFCRFVQRAYDEPESLAR